MPGRGPFGLASPGRLLALAALAGLGFCAWLGHRTYRDTLEVERLHFEAVATGQLETLRDHLAARETVARVVAASFVPPPGRIAPGALSAVDPRILGFVPDVTSFVWVPRVEPSEVPRVLEALAASGIAEPAILGPGRAPLAALPADRTLFPVLDALPNSPENRSSLGLDL
ncbi:MAG: hypothetical protein K2X74_04095, partial [Acetobacteraceae bacterium]|nr:hypothetical protein [Acetobacteraceae bacterium]